MISIEEAQWMILQATKRQQSEELPLLQALGRVAAKDTLSPFDIPLCDNSAMDGYAFSFACLQGDRLAVAGFAPAGHAHTTPVPPGSAVRIMTGAPIPPGCDTVVPIEEVEQTGAQIRLTGRLQQGTHIRRKGEDVKQGETVIADGSVIRPQEIGMLASLGMTTVPVYKAPTAAILATGDELLPLGEKPRDGQIVNSNSIAVAAQVIEAGGVPLIQEIIPDDLESTKRCMRKALEGVDTLITTGGVSVGDRDFVKLAIEEVGGRILFWKVNMKPGKPVAFAMIDGKPVFALPGNPVAAMVAFEEFVRPALLKMMGRHRVLRPVITARTTSSFNNKGDRPNLVRAMVSRQDGENRVSAIQNQSSANMLSLIESNGLLILPPATTLAAGDEANVILLDRDFLDQPSLLPTARITG
jgi:molybdopterin molybdotransferase